MRYSKQRELVMQTDLHLSIFAANSTTPLLSFVLSVFLLFCFSTFSGKYISILSTSFFVVDNAKPLISSVLGAYKIGGQNEASLSIDPISCSLFSL